MPLLVDPLEQFSQIHIERFGNRLQGPQANFLAPQLKVRNVIFVDAGLFGKVNLTPATLFPQLTDSLSEHLANISCHPHYGGVTLKTKSTLSCGQRILFGYRQEVAGEMPVVVTKVPS
jgi:hypothetical protein